MITIINHITLAVRDVERSFDFYHDVLMFKPLVKWNSGAYFLAGDGEFPLWFCLNRDPHCKASESYTHYAFSVNPQNFKALSQQIILSGESLYFKDPDGHKLEIHTGDWKQRLAAKEENSGSWQNIEWFV